MKKKVGWVILVCSALALPTLFGVKVWLSFGWWTIALGAGSILWTLLLIWALRVVVR